MATVPEVLKQGCRDKPEFISLEKKPSVQNTQGAASNEINFSVNCKKNDSIKKRKKDVANLGFENKKIVFKASEKDNLPICPLQLRKSSSPKGNEVSEKSLNAVMPSHSKKHIKILCENLSKEKNLKLRCESVLDLAVLCVSNNQSNILLPECLAALRHLSDSHKYASLAVCHALLLCSVTKLSLNLEDVKTVEESILKLVFAELEANGDKSQSVPDSDYEIRLLINEYSSVDKLCQDLFCNADFDVNSISISAIICLSFFNLSSLLEKSCAVSVNYTYKEHTLKYILGCTGKSTQEIVSENLSGISPATNFVNFTHLTVQQCLKIIEIALIVNTEVHYHFLQHEMFSLPHCLTRLLAWSVSLLFPLDKVEKLENKASFAFHRSTLVSILKILSVLSFKPNQYDDFTNVKGLMEKIMICGLKAYFELEDDSFDVLILCLELLINLHIKNRKTFALLCLRKFPINEVETVLSIEALIKILLNSLEKIKEIKTLKTNMEKNCEQASSNRDSKLKEDEKHSMELVLQAADKDMEHSTIASFISVLIVFFANFKQSFLELVKEKLSLELLEESLSVTRKFLQFAVLTGGMPESGILILRHTISKLQKMSSSP